MENFIITITYLLVGTALRRVPQFSSETGKVLNLFVIYVSLPALVLSKIHELAFSNDLLVPMLMPWLMLILSAAGVVVLSRLFGWERKVQGCLLLLVPLGNTSFLGVPMVKAFFGEQAISYALLYDQLGSFLALATYGSFVLAVYGAGQSRPAPGQIFAKILAFPPFMALVLALLLRRFPYPPVAHSTLEALASTLVPVVMIAVGFQLTLRLERQALLPLGLGLGVKLVIAPLLALLFCRSLGLGGEATNVSVFEAGMPPMVSAGALAIIADLSPPLTAALVGLGIILSFATLPLLFQLL